MILHVSAQRFCCRNRVARVVGHWGAKSAREKYKGSDGTANFGLLRDPTFLAARMGAVNREFIIINPPQLVLHRNSRRGRPSQIYPRNWFRTVIPCRGVSQIYLKILTGDQGRGPGDHGGGANPFGGGFGKCGATPTIGGWGRVYY